MSFTETESTVTDPEITVTIILLNDDLDRLKNFVQNQREQGLIGNISVDFTDALVDKVAIDLQETILQETDRINALIARMKNSKFKIWLSKFPIVRVVDPTRRQMGYIKVNIANVRTSAVRTTKRRNAHGFIYQCAFHERFPSDSHAKGGNLRQESLDDIYEQSMALMSFCKMLAPLLEGIKTKEIKFARSAQDCKGLIDSVADTLVSTIAVRYLPSSLLDGILAEAKMTLYWAEGLCMVGKDLIPAIFQLAEKSLQSWKDSISDAMELSELQTQTNLQTATTPFTFNIDEDVNNIQLDSAKFLQGVQQAGSTSENPVPETAGADEKLTSETITEKLPKLEDSDDILSKSENIQQGVQQVGSTSENPVPETAGADEKLTSETITEKLPKLEDSDDILSKSENIQQGVQQVGSTSENPVPGTTVADEPFTLVNVTEKLPKLIKLPVCFSNPPSRNNAGIVIRREDRGGYGEISEVKLHEPLEYSATTSGFSEPLTTETRSTSKVAVKYIRITDVRRTCVRITREGRVWSKMKHKNILPLIGFWKSFLPGTESVSLSFITLWLDDGDLLRYLKAHPEVDCAQRLKYLRDVADALSYMHNFAEDGPVVHGDLKANNVLVRGDQALLCDFGLSHLSDNTTGLITQCSTPWRWLAPERLSNSKLKPTPQSDMYSFGFVFYEVFTADIPWKDIDSGSSSTPPRHALSKQLDRPPEIIDMDHWKFIKSCWKAEPCIRPTAKKAFRDLERFIIGHMYATAT